MIYIVVLGFKVLFSFERICEIGICCLYLKKKFGKVWRFINLDVWCCWRRIYDIQQLYHFLCKMSRLSSRNGAEVYLWLNDHLKRKHWFWVQNFVEMDITTLVMATMLVWKGVWRQIFNKTFKFEIIRTYVIEHCLKIINWWEHLNFVMVFLSVPVFLVLM